MIGKDRTATMTGQSTPSPNEVIASSNWAAGGFDGWTAFNKVSAGTGWSTASGVRTATIRYDFGSRIWAASGYRMIIGTWNSPNWAPGAWTFEGSNDGSSWTVLDTQTGITWTENVWKEYSFTNATIYRYYRWNISDNAAGVGQTNMTEMEIWAPDLGGSILFNFI